MIFADLLFIYLFIPLFALCYALAGVIDRRLLPVKRTAGGRHAAGEPIGTCNCRNAVLIVFSIIFYAWGEPVYILLMLGSVTVNYIMGLMIDRGSKKSKPALAAGVILNIAAIGVFKYAGFIAATLNAVGIPMPVPDIALPIGISFYTFQSLSYLADVYKGKAPAQSNFFGLLLYISMFPQLIAGPIVRYTAISNEINTRTASIHDISEGSFRFLTGLGKKVILANQLSVIVAEALDGDIAALSAGSAWIGIAAFSMQIYFDFSGYSDMAIGMGRCMGFHFDENFNYPYISCSATEFWRRWHISLGSFFRDYVYIPMGGNRRHQPLNLLVVWFLTGLWHGASWNFVIWGLYFGLIILIEKYTLMKMIDRIPKIITRIYTVIIVVISWAIFYYDDFGKIGLFFKSMLALGSGGLWDIIAKNQLLSNIWLLAIAALFCVPVSRVISGYFTKRAKNGSVSAYALMTVFKTVSGAALLLVSTLLLIGATSNPFLYLRF